MIARVTVSLPGVLTGRQIIDAVRATIADGCDFVSKRGFDDGDVFEVGQSSGYSHKHLRVTPGSGGKLFRPQGKYEGSVIVEAHAWPCKIYLVRSGDEDVIEAVRAFAAGLECELRKYAL